MLLLEHEAGLPGDLTHGEVPSVVELGQLYGEPNAAFVAIHGGEPAGCVAVTALDATTAVMLRLYVRKEYRRLGVARALVNATIDFPRERGFERLVLETNRRLTAACELYASLGFTECEPFGAVLYECPTFMEVRLR